MSGRHAARRPQELSQRPKRVTENDEFGVVCVRMLKAMGVRCGTDPGALVYVEEIDQAWTDAKNLAYFMANKVYGYSQNEIARITGRTRQSIQQRIRSGEAVHNQITVAAGGAPLIRIGDLRAARAERYLQAELEDATAGPKQAEAYAELRATRERLRAVGE